MTRVHKSRQHSRRAITVLTTITVAGVILAGCSSGGDKVDIPSASGSGKLTIAVSDDEPGVAMKDGNSYTGFDIDTATYVAAKLGVPQSNITWVHATPETRESLLTSGKADLVVSTYSRTPQRAKVVDFAGPYFVAHQALLVRRNDTAITGPRNLDGRTLCTVSGTTSAAYVLAHYRGKITLLEKPNYSQCVQSLAAGDVDAVTTDDLILAGYASQAKYKGVLKVVGGGFTDEVYGIGVKKGDSAMVTKVNDALKDYISSGDWKKSLDANVSPSGYSVPSAPTVGTWPSS